MVVHKCLGVLRSAAAICKQPLIPSRTTSGGCQKTIVETGSKSFSMETGSKSVTILRKRTWKQEANRLVWKQEANCLLFYENERGNRKQIVYYFTEGCQKTNVETGSKSFSMDKRKVAMKKS